MCSYKNNTLKIAHSYSKEFSSYFSMKFVFSLKKLDTFLTYFIVSVCLWTNISHISSVHIANIKRCYFMKPSAYYFYVKTKISAKFHICVITCPNKENTFLHRAVQTKWVAAFFCCRGHHLRRTYLWWKQVVALLFMIVTPVAHIRIPFESCSISSNKSIPTVLE